MKNSIFSLLKFFIKPFFGTGIGKYFPFNKINNFYKKISLGKKITITTKYNFKMSLEPGRLIDDEIIHKGMRELGISNLLSEKIKRGDVFLDLGANIGYDSLLASTIVGEAGKVISFEPNLDNFNKLLHNIQLNDFNNIEAHKLGVGNKEEKIELFFDEKNPGATSVIKRVNHNKGTSEKIEIIVLDNFFQNIKKVDFIKMDIEGYEYEGFIGMKGILEKFSPQIIFEFSPVIYKTNHQDHRKHSSNILSFLFGLGYELYHIDNKDGTLVMIKDIGEYINYIYNMEIEQSDIYCIKK